jgi:hypothetical protein
MMKNLVVGVKRILEEKIIVNENIKTHDMKLQRIDADGKPPIISPPANDEEALVDKFYQH